jgi:TRAP-type C4-dicarboxylate transport system permease small subunit
MILRILFKISDFLDLFAKGVSLVFLSLMTTIMVAEVIWRNLFMSITWSEEVTTTFLGTWFVFIGASVPLRRGQLVSIQFIRSKLPEKVSRIAVVSGELMILAFLAVGVKYGFDLVNLAMTQPSPSLMFPMGYAYLGIPVGCSIMFYQTVMLMLHRRAASEISTVA